MKTCTKCKIEKDVSAFSKQAFVKSGYRSHCKSCISEYWLTVKDSDKIKKHEYYLKNKEAIYKRTRQYAKDNPEKVSKYQRKYEVNNRDKIKKSRDNIQYKLRNIVRSSLRKSLKNGKKAGSAVVDLGCSIDFLKKHLESLFTEGMAWDNHGLYGWHLDHIKALAKFDLTDREQFLVACNYKNLQPLWAKDNLSKGSK